MQQLPTRVAACVLLLLWLGVPAALAGAPQVPADTDQDGLSDALEQQLLEQFRPSFMIGANDCSVRPAAFTPGLQIPTVHANDGTIYGQAFPVANSKGPEQRVELHYFHLWPKDCGRHGHPLDTEHVAVLIQLTDAQLSASTAWKALYWYAGAHEDTVCDVSQIARASTLHADTHGATVWISPDKHASYLNAALCGRGCGADSCTHMVALPEAPLINLGEPRHPMNNASFITSAQWPLLAKMSTSNFPVSQLQRVQDLPANDIVWFRPGRHPVQGIISHSSTTEQALEGSERNTAVALSLAETSTSDALASSTSNTGAALSAASTSTGSALSRNSAKTTRALGSTAKHVGKALHLTPKPHADSDPR